MKPVKMFGLAALAALMAMAFVGATSALAESTAFCTTDEDPCSGKNQITHVHETSVGKAKLLSEPTVECNVLFLGDTFRWWVEDKGIRVGELVGLESFSQQIVGSFTYSSCNNSCAVTEKNGPAVLQVRKTGAELAAVTGEGLVELNCFFGFIKCSYNGEGLEGHGLGPLLVGSGNGQVTITGQETHIETGECPAEAFLDITTTPLIPTYISS